MTTALQNQFASSPPGCAVCGYQFSLGCPRASQDLAEPEAMLLVGTVIFSSAEAGNNAKALEVRLGIYPLCFQAVVCFSGTQIFVLLGAPAGPIDHHPIDFFTQAEAKCYRQFRLRKIARAPPDHPRLRVPLVVNADRRADRIAIRLHTLQAKSNAPRMPLLVVPV